MPGAQDAGDAERWRRRAGRREADGKTVTGLVLNTEEKKSAIRGHAFAARGRWRVEQAGVDLDCTCTSR